jgi:hypothetical protein
MPPVKIRPQIYNAEIVAGSLLVPESRKIARLLLNNSAKDAWHKSIQVKNILQKRSPATAKRQTKLIRNRLEPMSPELWQLIAKGSADVTTQALLAAAIKHSRMLGDFMNKVLRENWRIFKQNISPKDWDLFLESCAQVDPAVIQWSDLTLSKLRQVVFRILAEAKYVDGTRSLRILPVTIIPEVRNYLFANSEKYVLRCMEATM